MLYSSSAALIGNTPLVELKGLDAGVCRVFAKLEIFNPTGSIKDRIASSMVDAAEATGNLKPGGWIVEATAGNTGISLAFVSQLRGYQLCCVVPSHMSESKVSFLRSLGVDVVLVDVMQNKQDPDYFIKVAMQLANERQGFYVGQFTNEYNWMSHYQTTGPELLRDLPSINAFVAGCGTGGTLKGVGTFLKENKVSVDLILADPLGSVLAHEVDSRHEVTNDVWRSEGVGTKFIPKFFEASLIDDAYSFTVVENEQLCDVLWRTNGIKVGMSSAAVLAVALKYARAQKQPKDIAFCICDSAERYK